MCWSYDVSLATCSVVIGTVGFLLFRQASRFDLGHALFMSVFGSMQFIDLALWIQNEKEDLRTCSNVNQIITELGWYVIMIEPIFSLLSRMVIDKKFNAKWLGIYLALFFFLPHVGRLVMDCAWEYCAQLTPNKNLILGIGIDPNGGVACWKDKILYGTPQTEIPLPLRVMWLIGICVPFLGKKPLGRGLLHSTILTLTWLCGYFSQSHASVWCLANVCQSIFFILDPYLFGKGEEGKGVERGKRGNILQDNYLRKKVPEEVDVVIVGSGIGGLAVGGVLAMGGKRVLVLEQHYRAGGATHTFDEFDGLFDSGIHYVGANDFCVPLLGLVGDKEVKWAEMGGEKDGYLYDWFDMGGGKEGEKGEGMVGFRRGWGEVIKELVKHFPHEKDGIAKYFKSLQQARLSTYLFTVMKFFPRSWLNGWVAQWMLEKFLAFSAGHTSKEKVEECVQDPKLRAILSGGQLIDWNLAPDQTSWWVVASMMNYYEDGGFYPLGGSQNIAESIIPTIEKAGGRVLTNVRVEEIMVGKEGAKWKAVGVRLQNGDEIRANTVISDAGATNTFLKLLPEDWRREGGCDVVRLQKLKASNGHMTAFVNLKGTSEENGLCGANIHSFMGLKRFDYDISKMQRAVYNDPEREKQDCLVTLTSPSAKDPHYEQMFPGRSNVLLLSEGRYEWFENMESELHSERTEDYKKFKKSWESVFLERMYHFFPKTRGKVESIEIGTPLSTEHFLAADRGGSYGLEWTRDRFEIETMRDFFHPETSVEGLFLTGEASLFGGFCGALVSGFVTSFHVLGVFGLGRVILGAREKW